MVVELNCNSLENFHSWTVVLYGQGLLHRLFYWKVLRLPIDLRKPRNLSTLNNLQYTVLQAHHICVMNAVLVSPMYM